MNRKYFILVSILGILFLTSSWIMEPFKSFWVQLDTASFFFLNSWIKTSSFWQNFWALINHKYTDWVFDIVMLSFYIPYIFIGEKKTRLERAKNVLICIIAMALTILLINRYVARKWIHFHRMSPSLVFTHAPRLSEIVTWIKIKVTSRDSFPGDHGTTACIFAISTYLLMGRKIGLIGALVSTFFILPRLIVGAHWLSDVLVGSLSIALFSMGLVSIFIKPKIRHESTV